MSFSKTTYTGVFTAMITPFRQGRMDEDRFQQLVERQIQAGTAGIIPCGTTGESPTLSDDEQQRLIALAVETVAGRVPVVAGAGSNATQHAIHLAQNAQKAGANGLLVVTPYYNKPTQEGLYQHYKAIHDAVGIPLFLYNVPGRCVISVAPDTMGRLAQLPRIWGVKDATGDLTRVPEQRALTGPDFIQWTGDDSTALPHLSLGGVGCVSVLSNLVPEKTAALQKAWRAGDRDAALQHHQDLAPLAKALFLESSPAPVKYGASIMGLCENELRLPLVPIRPETEAKVRQALAPLVPSLQP